MFFLLLVLIDIPKYCNTENSFSIRLNRESHKTVCILFEYAILRSLLHTVLFKLNLSVNFDTLHSANIGLVFKCYSVDLNFINDICS